MTSPPGGGRSTFPKRASSGPAKRSDARIRSLSARSTLPEETPEASIVTVFSSSQQTSAPSGTPVDPADPAEAQARLEAGAGLQRSRRLREAILDLHEAVRLDPQDATGYNNLGKDKEARQGVDRAVGLGTDRSSLEGTQVQFSSRQSVAPVNEAGPPEALASFQAGAALHQEGRFEEAIADYDEAIRLNPQFAMAYANRGAAYSGLGQHERAIQDYDEAIRLDTEDASAYYNRGNDYGDLGQDERAIQEYDEAIRLDPQYALAYNNRGLSYGILGQTPQAIQDYDEAIRLNPQYAAAYVNRS